MLITFKSSADADVLMFGEPAKAILQILGKDPGDAKGIITVEQLPDAIAALRAAIADDRARHGQPNQDEEEAAQEAGQAGMNAAVSLAQRAYPLLTLMERSLQEKVPVTWGV